MREADETRTAAQKNLASGRASARFRLVVIEGPAAGTSIELPAKGSRLLLGTSRACDLRLADPSVSRRHATLELAGARLDYTDLGSTNGTYANEVAIVEAQLWGGERLRLGDTTLLVEVDEGVVEAELSEATSFGRVVGASIPMRQLYPVLARLAMERAPLVIEGETGTGKELVAESLHEMGPRSGGRFVVLDPRLGRASRSTGRPRRAVRSSSTSPASSPPRTSASSPRSSRATATGTYA